MNTISKSHFLNGITEIIQLFDDILMRLPAPVLLDTNHKSCEK